MCQRGVAEVERPGPRSLYVAQSIQGKVMCYIFVHPDRLHPDISFFQTQVQDRSSSSGPLYPCRGAAHLPERRLATAGGWNFLTAGASMQQQLHWW